MYSKLRPVPKYIAFRSPSAFGDSLESVLIPIGHVHDAPIFYEVIWSENEMVVAYENESSENFFPIAIYRDCGGIWCVRSDAFSRVGLVLSTFTSNTFCMETALALWVLMIDPRHGDDNAAGAQNEVHNIENAPGDLDQEDEGSEDDEGSEEDNGDSSSETGDEDEDSDEEDVDSSSENGEEEDGEDSSSTTTEEDDDSEEEDDDSSSKEGSDDSEEDDDCSSSDEENDDSEGAENFYHDESDEAHTDTGDNEDEVGNGSSNVGVENGAFGFNIVNFDDTVGPQNTSDRTRATEVETADYVSTELVNANWSFSCCRIHGHRAVGVSGIRVCRVELHGVLRRNRDGAPLFFESSAQHEERSS